MDFLKFKLEMQEHISKMLIGKSMLFVTDIDKDVLWNLYLDSFPPGTNEVFRERREYDCSCCRHFIKTFGNVVTIEELRVVSIWDFKSYNKNYQTVVDALASYVKDAPIVDVFATKERVIGTDFNHERSVEGKVKEWQHFHYVLPAHFVSRSGVS